MKVLEETDAADKGRLLAGCVSVQMPVAFNKYLHLKLLLIRFFKLGNGDVWLKATIGIIKDTGSDATLLDNAVTKLNDMI